MRIIYIFEEVPRPWPPYKGTFDLTIGQVVLKVPLPKAETEMVVKNAWENYLAMDPDIRKSLNFSVFLVEKHGDLFEHLNEPLEWQKIMVLDKS